MLRRKGRTDTLIQTTTRSEVGISEISANRNEVDVRDVLGFLVSFRTEVYFEIKLAEFSVGYRNDLQNFRLFVLTNTPICSDFRYKLNQSGELGAATLLGGTIPNGHT